MTRQDADIRADMSQFYSMKAALEDVLGHASYAKLKEGGTLPKWKAETNKLLKAVELAIVTTVKIADKEWYDEVRSVLDLGRGHIPQSESIADLFANLSATLTRLVFIQIGYLPSHRVETRQLTPSNWKLDPVRTVQYVQDAKQKVTAQHLQNRRSSAR